MWAVGLTAAFVMVQALPPFDFLVNATQYTELHLTFELVSMAVSVMIFGLAWNLRTTQSNAPIIVIGLFSLAIALLDLAHVLSFPGMPDLVTPNVPDKTVDFWLAGRFVAAMGFVLLALLPERHWPPRLWLPLVAATITLCGAMWWVGIAQPAWLPRTFVEASGLTEFKVISEYVISAVYAVAAVLLALRARGERNVEFAWLAAAAWTIAMSEVFFTRYTTMSDSYNMVGHLFKVLAYLMVYRAVFVAGVQRPTRELADEARLIGALIDSVPDLISFTDRDGRYLGANRAFSDRLGVAQEAVPGSTADTWRVDDPGRARRRRAQALARSGATDRYEESIPDPTGGEGLFDTVQTPYFDNDGDRLGIIEISRDVTAQRESEQRIEDLALLDQLTGLPNRPNFLGALQATLTDPETAGLPHAVVYLDLDDFKSINDTLGLRVGDLILRETASRLRMVTNARDFTARLGGDEFSLLLIGAGPAEAARAAERIIDAIDVPFLIDHYDLSVTSSIGIALYPSDGIEVEELTRRADAAMYQAKRDGRDTFRFHTDEVREKLERRVRLLSALRRAVTNGELRVHYQPQVHVASGRVVGVEALVRWQHAELGLLPPAEFIDLAEDSGLIIAIGDWVLRTAIRDALAWTAAGAPPVTLAVNLSAVQLLQSDLPSRIEAILAETGFPAGRLAVELTETVAMRNPEMAATAIEQLRDIGLLIAIDDFGTGYSSMAYLKRFHVHQIKIDKSFVRDLGVDPDDEAIVGALIRLARALDVETIAEGVETSAQYDLLRARGCDLVQGYYFSRPIPSEDLLAFLKPGARRVTSRPSHRQ